MKRLLLAGAAVFLMVAAVLIAGCTTTTTNNTTSPTTTQGTQQTTATTGATNVGQYLTATMPEQGLYHSNALFCQATMQNGAGPYSGVVSDSNGTYNVAYEVMNTPQDTQVRYQEVVNGYVAQGVHDDAAEQHGVVRLQLCVFYGRGSIVACTSPLMPYYVMTMTGYSTSPQRPLQQSMWSHMWGEMRDRCMGPYMGYNISPDMPEHMQQEMNEHMGGTPYGMPYGGGPMMDRRT